MITSLQIQSGYGAKIPMLKKPLQFNAGLNILWGPNGCGKTTLLKTLAAYSFCPGGGWTRLFAPMEILGLLGDAAVQLPEALAKFAPGHAKAEFGWDRIPVFFSNGNDGVRIDAFAEDETDSPDGITSVEEQMLSALKPKSSGETRASKLDNALRLLQSAPDFAVFEPSKAINDLAKACFQAQADYLAKRTDPATSRVTILMDEPDKHLDAEKAYAFWTELVPHLSQHAQVIISSHHPFCLSHIVGARWIHPKGSDPRKMLDLYRKALAK